MTGFEAILTKAIVTNVAKEVIPKISDKIGIIKDKIDHEFNNKLAKYLNLNYEKLNTSTSQLFRNQNLQLSKLYVPLTLYSVLNYDKSKINVYPKELLDKNKKIIIQDSAGMGKSTILKMIFRYAIDEDIVIPFYIDLKSLIKNDKVNSIIDTFIDTFPSYKKVPQKEFLQELFENGEFIFLFDGADEVPDKYKIDVFNEVNKFVDINNKSKFVIATREEDKILSSFNDFMSFHIKKLETEEAYKIIHNYDFGKDIAEKLIIEINKEENEAVLEFLENPLLTTLLITAYTYSRKVPLKKNLFYRTVYQSLYENHDATKIGHLSREKESKLDINEFEFVLAQLAANGRLREKIEYSESELTKVINNINEMSISINFDPKSFINDIMSKVPVFRKDGTKFLWQHKSIQEYFFSLYILKVLKGEERIEFLNELLKLNDTMRYQLVFDILYDEDQEFFTESVTIPIFSKYLKDIKKSKNIEDSFNYFYKKIYIWKEEQPEEYIGLKEIYENLDKFLEEHNIDKKELKKIKKNYSAHNVGHSISTKNVGLYNVGYHHRHYTILDVLYNKKVDFIYKYEYEVNSRLTKEEDFKENDFIHNLSSSFEDTDKIIREQHEKIILIDTEKLEKFIKTFKDIKKKKKKQFERFKKFDI